MKNYATILFLILVGSCSFTGKEDQEVYARAPKEGECPKDPKDEVIPIIYGMPAKEYFQKADSGLVILAGCILPENPKYYFCKVHKIEF